MIKGFGAQLYTVRDCAATPAGVETALQRVAAIGYRSVQVSGICEMPAADLAVLTRKYGLAVGLTHTPPARLRGCLKQVMRDHEKLGCRIVGLGAMPQEYRDKGEAGLRDFIADYAPIAEELSRNGFLFAYHNHAFDFVKYGQKTGLDILIDGFGSDGFRLTFDTYWAQRAGITPAAFIERHGPLIAALHLKDTAATAANDAEMAELGRGNMDWAAIIDAGKRQGVEWYMVEQDTCAGDPFESLRISYEYIKNSGRLNGTT